MEQNDLQRALMAVLFAAGEPVDAKRLSQTLEHDEAEIHEAVNLVKQAYRSILDTL